MFWLSYKYMYKHTSRQHAENSHDFNIQTADHSCTGCVHSNVIGLISTVSKPQEMKIAALFPTVAVVLVLLLSLRSDRSTSGIEIKIFDCRDTTTAYLGEVQILKNSKKFKTVSPEWDGMIKLNAVPPDIYEFRYTTIFGTEAGVMQDARKAGNYTDTICTNSLDYNKETYRPVIDHLQPEEEYVICYKSQGCFHYVIDSLFIKRNDNNYSASHGGVSKTLNSSQVELLRRFELELNHMKGGDCTTIDKYQITYDGHIVNHTTDGSCDWHGFRYLLKNLGFSKNGE